MMKASGCGVLVEIMQENLHSPDDNPPKFINCYLYPVLTVLLKLVLISYAVKPVDNAFAMELLS